MQQPYELQLMHCSTGLLQAWGASWSSLGTWLSTCSDRWVYVHGDLGTDVCRWMFLKNSQHGSRSTRWPFKLHPLWFRSSRTQVHDIWLMRWVRNITLAYYHHWRVNMLHFSKKKLPSFYYTCLAYFFHMLCNVFMLCKPFKILFHLLY